MKIKYFILMVIMIFSVGCASQKTVERMYAEKQKTLQVTNNAQVGVMTAAFEACKADTNPGLCAAFVSNSMAQAATNARDNNSVPIVANPFADITKTLINVGAKAYLGNITGDTIAAGFNAIRGTANDVSTNIAGANSSINVSGDYYSNNSGRINSNDDINNSDNSVHDNMTDSNNDNSVDNSNNSINDSYNDNSDNSNHDNDNSPVIPDPNDGG